MCPSARRLPPSGLGERRAGRRSVERCALWATLALDVAAAQQAADRGARRAATGAVDRALRVDRRAAVRRAGGRRAADGPRRGRADHRRLRRAAAARRGRGRRAAGRARRRGAAPRARRGSRRRPAQPGPGEVAAAPRRHRGARHPGLAARGRCATRTRSSTRCWRGARPSGSRPRTATAGSTSTSAPTGGCAASGRLATAPPGG